MNTYNIAVKVRMALTITIFALLLSWVLSSCEQHELCYNHDHLAKLNVTMDWRNDPAAEPGSMYLFLFPEDSTKCLRRDFAGHTSFRTDILVGLGYDVVTLNSDFKKDIIQYRDSMRKMSVTTGEAVSIDELGVSVLSLPKSRANDGREEDMREQTDAMWSDHSTERIYLSHERYYKGEDVKLTMFPRPLHCNYRIIVKEVKNKNKVKGGIAASLSGLCGSRNVYTAERNGDIVTIPFAMLNENRTVGMENTIKCFGRATDESVPNKLSFYTVMKDGSKRTFVFDVTDQVKKAPDPRNVTIVIDCLSLPENIGENSGIKPGVSKWQVVDIPLKL